jgi:hypothetical protein
MNEDTDFNQYDFADRELPDPPSNWKGDLMPDTVHTQKAPADFLSSTTSPETTPCPSAPASAVSTDVPSDDASEIEESDTQP